MQTAQGQKSKLQNKLTNKKTAQHLRVSKVAYGDDLRELHRPSSAA